MKKLIPIFIAAMLTGCQPENYENITCYWTVALDRVCVERQANRINPMNMLEDDEIERYYATADDMFYMMRDHFERGGTHTELVQLFIDTLEHYDAN